MKIKFSNELVKHLAMYLDLTIAEMADDPNFSFSTIYLYKIVDSSCPITVDMNEALNEFWNSRELTEEDLNNIYKLIDLLATGSKKEKVYKLKKYRKKGIKKFKGAEK